MLSQVELKTTFDELREVKDAYSLANTSQAIKVIFNERYPNKELMNLTPANSAMCIETETITLLMWTRDK